MTSKPEKGEKYSAKLPSFNNLEVHRKQKQTIFMYCIKWFNMQVFIHKKIQKKKIYTYTNLFMANIV